MVQHLILVEVSGFEAWVEHGPFPAVERQNKAADATLQRGT
jgi:hypothetical protein